MVTSGGGPVSPHHWTATRRGDSSSTTGTRIYRSRIDNRTCSTGSGAQIVRTLPWIRIGGRVGDICVRGDRERHSRCGVRVATAPAGSCEISFPRLPLWSAGTVENDRRPKGTTRPKACLKTAYGSDETTYRPRALAGTRYLFRFQRGTHGVCISMLRVDKNRSKEGALFSRRQRSARVVIFQRQTWGARPTPWGSRDYPALGAQGLR